MKKGSKKLPNLHFLGFQTSIFQGVPFTHVTNRTSSSKLFSRLYLGENPNGGFIVSGGWSWIRSFFFFPLKVCRDLSTISMIRNVFFNEEMSHHFNDNSPNLLNMIEHESFESLRFNDFLIRSDGWKSRREKTPHVEKRIYDRCDFLFRLCLRSVSAHLCGPVTCPSLMSSVKMCAFFSFPERRYKNRKIRNKKLRKSHPRIHFIWSQGFSHDDKCMVES